MFTAKVKVIEHFKTAVIALLILFGAFTVYIEGSLQRKECVRLNMLGLQITIGKTCQKW
ncbi:MAG: hypothetical protein HC936_10695 [Leptolyngbyaceae cyanobacterium SU_3_3]|nr:hypothetical protein [Leptolyngbyaceae cyanobacterium SU_3_3]NJR49845.1 hypothetical protein [Leptolyngbyaceae cyanobacterium CSU_1_3]